MNGKIFLFEKNLPSQEEADKYATITVRYRKDWEHTGDLGISIEFDSLQEYEPKDKAITSAMLLAAHCGIESTAQLMREAGISSGDLLKEHDRLNDWINLQAHEIVSKKSKEESEDD